MDIEQAKRLAEIAEELYALGEEWREINVNYMHRSKALEIKGAAKWLRSNTKRRLTNLEKFGSEESPKTQAKRKKAAAKKKEK